MKAELPAVFAAGLIDVMPGTELPLREVQEIINTKTAERPSADKCWHQVVRAAVTNASMGAMLNVAP